MRVALVHDDLVQWGGAERMLLGLSEIFPDAPIYTSLFSPDLAKQFKGKKIITSFLQRIPGWKALYKALLPLYPIAFEQFDFSKYDLVVSQSTRFAKSIITKPQTLHICYCHTPPRFLWDSSSGRFNFLTAYFSYLRVYDRISSNRVDHFIAGSENARQRIKKNYLVDCPVVYPYVDIDRFSRLESFDGGYFLVISRLNKYKRVDIAIEACSKLNLPLKIIGSGPEMSNLKNLAEDLGGEVDFLGSVPDGLVGEVLSGAKALIICAKEDFGITALEAQVLGKAVIAYGQGGVLESVIEGKTGYFFKDQSYISLMEILKGSDLSKINSRACQDNAALFSKDNFMLNFKKQTGFLLN